MITPKRKCLFIIALAFIYLIFFTQFENSQFFDKENQKEKVQGFLGETDFSIPSDIVRNVEYDNDPGWGESRSTGTKNRQKFRSFGLRMDFPDLRLLPNNQNSSDLTVRITATANSFYGNSEFLDLSFQEINRDPLLNYTENRSAHGLRYFPLKTNNNIERISAMRDFDVYIKTNPINKVVVFIRCGNSRGEKSLCRHYFQINELKTRLTLIYERKLLPEWSLIQKSSISNLNSFSN